MVVQKNLQFNIKKENKTDSTNEFVSKFLEEFKGKASIADYFYDKNYSLKKIYALGKMAKFLSIEIQMQVFSFFLSILQENKEFLLKNYYKNNNFNYPANYWLAYASLTSLISLQDQRVDKLLEEIALDSNYISNIRLTCVSGLFLRSGLVSNRFQSKKNLEIFRLIIENKSEKDKSVIDYAYKYLLISNILENKTNLLYKEKYWKMFGAKDEFSAKSVAKSIEDEIKSLKRYYNFS